MKGNKIDVKNNNSINLNDNHRYSKLFCINYLVEFPKMKFCFLYLIFLGIIIFLFIINYLKTKNAFDNNNFVNLNPEKICSKGIKIFVDCLKNNKIYDKCVYENKAVEDCYDEIYSMNVLCYIYLSELDFCLNNNNYNFEKESQIKNTLKKICGTQMDELIQCSKIYKYIKLDKDKLIDNLKQ